MQGHAHAIASISAHMLLNAGPKGGVVIDVALRNFPAHLRQDGQGKKSNPLGQIEGIGVLIEGGVVICCNQEHSVTFEHPFRTL